ncbi:hypothetical protein QQX98_005369 [Neonectria punicea]|uniref:AB hydrolase-1 domain-containing protein n=1 Tax=Neonectria punicea TaxID=979145 RepID=A0ABR1H4Z6_9HYPO
MHFSTLSFAYLVGVAYAQNSICNTECQKGCDDACQAVIQEAYDAESKLWVNDIVSDPFHSTPSNISAASPGDVLRWENVPAEQLRSNWTIPAGLSLSRSIRLCSTTNNKGLYYDWKAPFILAESGYAVVAPDYAGQGSDIPQGFMYESGFLHAADVAYSLIAAKKVLGNLSEKWAVYGHSEGGMTAWRTAERLAIPGEERLHKAGKFIGAVAAAPALRPQKLIPLSWAETGTGGGPFSVYFLQSLAGLFPDQIKVEDYLSDTALQRLDVLDNPCFQTGIAAVGQLTPETLFKNTSWLEHPDKGEQKFPINRREFQPRLVSIIRDDHPRVFIAPVQDFLQLL